MFITAVDININQDNFNPTISITDGKIKKSQIEYPDPNSYFILSEAGKNYVIEENLAYLLNVSKGYFQPQFRLTPDNATVINFAKILFEETKPIDGAEKEALVRAIAKSGKAKSSLKNRL